MKISFLIVLLLALACSSTHIEPEVAVAQETKPESPEVDDQELSSEIVSAETIIEDVKVTIEETVKPVVETPKSADVEIAKAEPVPEKAVNMKSPEEKTVPIPKVKVIPQEEVKKAIEIPPKPLLKLKGYKILLLYRKTSDNNNYIYASKVTNVEIDGRKFLKIKVSKTDIYISLPIERKLKSGKIFVSGIITLNNRTLKLEFEVLSSKKTVDFALSNTSLKKF